MKSAHRLALLSVLLCLSLNVNLAQEPLLDLPLAVQGATVVTRPGQVIENATVVMDRGRIIAVGAAATIPAGARLIDGRGLYVYAGFIDAFTRTGVNDARSDAAEERRVEGAATSLSEDPKAGMPEANRHGIFARRSAEELIDLQESTYAPHRAAGFALGLVAPPRAIIGGSAALLELGDLPLRRAVVRAGVAQTGAFESPRERALRYRGNYPRTPLGIIAHTRQLFCDAQWYAEMERYAAGHADARPPLDADLRSLQSVLQGQPVIWEAHSADEIHRALNLAEEFGYRPIIAGGREAWRVSARLKRMNVPVLLSAKVVRKPRDYQLELEKLRPKAENGNTSLYGAAWQQRPFEPSAAYEAAMQRRRDELENAARLSAAGVTWCLAGYELKQPADALRTLREAVKEGGLGRDQALTAVTVAPATVLGVGAEFGAIEVGKRADLVIFSRDYLDKEAQVRWTIIDGRAYEPERSKPVGGGPEGRGRGRRGGRGAAPPDADSPNPPDHDSDREEEETDEPVKARPAASQPAVAGAAMQPAGAAAGPSAAAASAPSAANPTDDAAATSKPTAPTPQDDIYAHVPGWPIETPAGRQPKLKTGGDVLLRNAYVIPVVGDDLPDTSVLVQGGKIAAIGRDLTAPPGVVTLDLGGCVLMPGIVDPHSHIALSAVNEWTNSVVPEVRCADVILHDDPAMYFALSGGCTTIHAMHGSANTIGGQCVVIKLKYGKPAAELILPDAPRTVKWALGENVKRPGLRVGWNGPNDPRRFPGTRMGVEATLRRALTEGRSYAEQVAQDARDRAAGRETPPLRRDLRREALAEILAGRIWVNTHCYRADEVLRLLEVAEDFEIRIAVLHHVLEAYRIMPEIRRHGSGTATFADWWAYKLEAYDAVPHNAGMLLRAGINSTLKSDSADLMRHMNLEAAKAMKYAGLSPNEALGLITINGARQFGLEKRVGSIEVGKDADLAVFDGHPLDTFAKCVLTTIEGEVYFQHRDFDPQSSKPPVRKIKTFAAVSSNAGGVAAAAPRAGRAGEAAIAGSIDQPTAAAGKEAEAGADASAGARGGPRPDDNPNRIDGRKRNTVFVKNPTEPPASDAAKGAAACYAIVGATLHPISGPAIAEGTLVMRDGKIAALGPAVGAPSDAVIVRAHGLHVWPGLINAATEVGLHEVGQAEVTVDTSEVGRFQPDLMAISAFNPHSAMIEVTRAEGITTVVVLPNGPIVAGQAGALDLSGWTMNGMLRTERLALLVNLPSVPTRPLIKDSELPFDDWDEESSESDDEIARSLKALDRFFRDAGAYAAARRAAAESAGEVSHLSSDPRFDAMEPYVSGRKPVLFAANGYKTILEALLFADRHKLRPVIVGGREAWKLADLLAKRRVPVIYEGTMSLPPATSAARQVTEAWDANYRGLGELLRADVKVAACHRTADLAKLLPNEAGFAIAHGADPDAVMRALTLTPAEILGLDKQIGSLDVGKVANVIITTDHPCQATTQVRHVFIGGVPQALENKHSRDAEKFANRPAIELPAPRNDLRGAPSQSR